MRLAQALRDWQARREASGYDARADRADIAEIIAGALIQEGLQVRTFVASKDGPLGGESSALSVVRTLPDGTTQGFNIAVYAKGVYCADNERVRSLIS